MRFPALASALALTLSLGGCLPMAIFAQGGYGYQTNFGTYVADREVNAFCLTPKLRFAIWNFEGQFGHKIVLNSGYRDRSHNEATGGKEHSYHIRCMAADFLRPVVPKEQLIAIYMVQVSDPDRIALRNQFRTMVQAAIID